MLTDYTVNLGHYNRENNLQCYRPTHTTSVMTHICYDTEYTVCVLIMRVESVSGSKCYPFDDLENLHFYDYAKALLLSCNSGEWSELIKFTNTVKLATIINNYS